ncbi:DUF2437 domain-containing protein, partial [Conyzicola sp.]|uniref:DUF2437 domain-containing protein n=1 Tax=Conyzicola sp. TaxID=1969404 RepID=UPI003988A77E
MQRYRRAVNEPRTLGSIDIVKIARFSTGGDPRFGIVDGHEIVVLQGDPKFSAFDTTEEREPNSAVRLLAPVNPR